MKKHQRDQQGRAIKFRDTPAQRHKRRTKWLMFRLMARGMLYAHAARIQTIHNTTTKTKEQRIAKAFAIAGAVIDGVQATLKLHNHIFTKDTKQEFDNAG